MESRKQKRLGPAPIASFEKSFEDSSSTAAVALGGTSNITCTSIECSPSRTTILATSVAASNTVKHQEQPLISSMNYADAKDLNQNGGEMESNTKAISQTTNSRQCHQELYDEQQQQQSSNMVPTITTTSSNINTIMMTNTNINTNTLTHSDENSFNSKFEGEEEVEADMTTATATTTSNNTSKPTNGSLSKTTCNGSNSSGHPVSNNGKQRPPTLKNATVNVTTTLVSSSEGQETYRGTTTLMTPATPRIELSRASSSSHHEEDSRESSPENVFEQVGHGTLQESLELGFREEGALELRSSTEELFFMDPEQRKEQERLLQQQQQQLQQQIQQQKQQDATKFTAPQPYKFDDHQQSYLQQHQRKDSASSEVAALLCISGRTSRISSVGSQGSAVSRLSAVSGISRSPSPHRMLLETSFCGPKPLEGTPATGIPLSVEPATTELLEQALLARKPDPTSVVLAEGIKLENSPRRKPTSLSNGDAKKLEKILQQGRPMVGPATAKPPMVPAMGAQRRNTKSPGQMVIGKTPSGTEYIRINLKPDHMYEDKGVASHEQIVEAPNTISPVYAKIQKKPGTLSLGSKVVDEKRLTPTASPKPGRHSALSKDMKGSRSPSPATISVSRKSSFSSLFRLGGKDSPDSPRERSRSRSKSKERTTPQSQNATPSKQKSVLAIFKTGKRGSSSGTEAKSSKSSSPIESHEMTVQPSRSRTNTPFITATGSRPNSRLKYYDDPVDGCIHIPLHTPPDEKETKQLLEDIQQLTAEANQKPIPAPITPGQLAFAAANLKPIGARKSSGNGSLSGPGPTPPPKPPPKKCTENLDAIHSLPQDDDNKDRSWSLEVNQFSSQDSQGTGTSEGSYASAIRIGIHSTTLANVKEHEIQENGVAAEAEIHRLPSVESTVSTGEPKIVQTIATVNTSAFEKIEDDAVAAKERRKLMFATRLGSGSQEQIFATQFSISKTESQSSQLSEQQPETISEESDALQRQATVIRRSEEDFIYTKPMEKKLPEKKAPQKQTSISTSEDEKPFKAPPPPPPPAKIVMRRKESADRRQKSKSSTEEEASEKASQRHSRYLENFDVRKKYQDTLPRKHKREPGLSDEFESQERKAPSGKTVVKAPPTLPKPPPPSTAPSPSPPPPAYGGSEPVSHESRSHTPISKTTMRSQSQSPVDRSSRQTPTKPPRSATPTKRMTPTTPPSVGQTSGEVISPPIPSGPPSYTQSTFRKSERQSANSTDEPAESSESERDSERGRKSLVSSSIDPKKHQFPHHVGPIEDHESTGLVSQESFDDELPYIPTTLPEERALGVSLIPMKERVHMEVKTCPLDRPRSTTPLNPSHLEEYCGITGPPPEVTELTTLTPSKAEKLRISLPRKDSTKEKTPNTKSPRRVTTTNSKSWFEFAEEGLRATANLERKDSNKQLLKQKAPNDEPQETAQATQKTQQQVQQILQALPKPVKPPQQTTKVQTPQHSHQSTQRKLSGHWIDFENIPEKRKPPKRITTLPRDSPVTTARQQKQLQTKSSQQPDITATIKSVCLKTATATATTSTDLTYNYVKPEDCQCECHESERDPTIPSIPGATCTAGKPLTNVDLLQQGEDMLPLLDAETHDGIEPSDSSREYSYYTDDEAAEPIHRSSSSRSRSSSSRLNEFPRRDGSRSPRGRKFPDRK